MTLLCSHFILAPYLAGSSPTGGLRPSLPTSVDALSGGSNRSGRSDAGVKGSLITCPTGQQRRPEQSPDDRIPTRRTWARGSQPVARLGAVLARLTRHLSKRPQTVRVAGPTSFRIG